MTATHDQRRYLAFTYVELLVVLALGVILLAISLPSFNRLVVQARLEVGANTLVSLIRLARSEAINRGQVVVLCPSEEGLICSEDWRDGQAVFVERAGQGALLKRLPRLPGHTTLRWFSSLGQNQWLWFAPSGVTKGQNGHFLYCDDRLNRGVSVVVSRSGRVRIAMV